MRADLERRRAARLLWKGGVPEPHTLCFISADKKVVNTIEMPLASGRSLTRHGTVRNSSRWPRGSRAKLPSITLVNHMTENRQSEARQGGPSVAIDPDPSEAIARHVVTVLHPARMRALLEQALSELEEEIEERLLVGRAKRIMQARDSVSAAQGTLSFDCAADNQGSL